MTVKEIISLIEEHNLAITANGTMFRTDKPSTLSVVLAKWLMKELSIKML